MNQAIIKDTDAQWNMQGTQIRIICVRNVNKIRKKCEKTLKSLMFMKVIASQNHSQLNTITNQPNINKRTFWHQDLKYQPSTMDSVFLSTATISKRLNTLTIILSLKEESHPIGRKANHLRKVYMKKKFLKGGTRFSMKGKLILVGMCKISSYEILDCFFYFFCLSSITFL